MKLRAAGLLLLTALSSVAYAAPAVPPHADRAPVYSKSVERLITSQRLGEYRIMISRPRTLAPADGYPVLYVLDGDDYFAPATDLANHLLTSPDRQLEPGIIVAIGYPDDSRRSYDYLPPSPISPNVERKSDGTPYIDEQWGGADLFLDFLDKELRPMVERYNPIDKNRQALFGHSYGGLLAVHALFTRPAMFQTYLISSPSLSWNGRYVLSEEPAFAGKLQSVKQKITAVVTVGEYEQAMSPEQANGPDAAERAARSARRRSVDSDRELSQRLDTLAPDLLRSTFKVFPGQTHGTVAFPAIAHGLPTAFAAQH